MTKKQIKDELHAKHFKYPMEWHKRLKKAKDTGKTSMNEAAYIKEALRQKLVKDGILL